MPINTPQDIFLKASCKRALEGHIPKTLRSVSVEIKNEKVLWKCVFDIQAKPQHFDMLSYASTEMIADFPDYGLEEDFEIVAFPQKYISLKWEVYRRIE